MLVRHQPSVYLTMTPIFFWRARLDPGNLVFQAELLAIREAIRWAGEIFDLSFLISSDIFSGPFKI